MQATHGNFYGTTLDGGYYSKGTVFELSLGFGGPFVKVQPTSGEVGTAVIILGSDLARTTSVRFHGRAATFTVASSSEITTTVPTRATSGRVTVVTPQGTLYSNVGFRVTPQISTFSPDSGAVGTEVTITGVSLRQTTEVSFGGVNVSRFTVISDTEVEATVPPGAKTGHVVITTAGGTAINSGLHMPTSSISPRRLP